MTETQLKNRVRKHLREVLPKALIFKHSERYFSGMPDMQIIFDKNVCFMELKKPDGVVSKIQQVYIDRINRQGIVARVVRSIDDVNACLREAGMV